MSEKEQLKECLAQMEDAMCEIQFKRDIWQNEILYWVVKSIYLLLKRALR
jgi:hypothetical protein